MGLSHYSSFSKILQCILMFTFVTVIRIYARAGCIDSMKYDVRHSRSQYILSESVL